MKKDKLSRKAGRALNKWNKRRSAKKAQAKKAKRNARKKAKHARKSMRYRALREKIIRRADGRCEYCGQPTDYFEMHHLEQVQHRPDLIFDESNVFAICLVCHQEVHPWLHRA